MAAGTQIKSGSAASAIPPRMWVWFARRVVKLMFRFCGGLEVEGRENVPREGSVLLCANHISDCDPLAVLVILPRDDFAVLAKEELFRIPILGPVIRSFGAFPIVRDSADRSALKQGQEVLEAHRALVIFPEGRLSENGCLQKLLPGAAMLALKTSAPIVPVGLIGTDRVLPYGKVIPRPAGRPVRVRYGNPIQMREFAGFSRKEARAALTLRLENELASLTGQPAPAQS